MSQETKVLLGIGLATLLILGVGVFLVSKSSSSTAETKPVDAAVLVKADSNKLAGANSKTTIVEFGDFQCPSCGAVHPMVKEIVTANKDNLTFVYRNFPLTQHKNAQIAAEAAEAAGAQGKYWEMHDKLFDNQDAWSESDKPLDTFVSYAKELELDTEKFRNEVEANKYADKINADQNDGIILGVNSTPTFYIDGVKFTGDYSNFKSQIEAKVKQ